MIYRDDFTPNDLVKVIPKRFHKFKLMEFHQWRVILKLCLLVVYLGNDSGCVHEVAVVEVVVIVQTLVIEKDVLKNRLIE